MVSCALKKANLVSNGRASVELDLSDVSLLLAEGQLVDLGVDDGTDDLAVLVDLVDLGLVGLLALLSAKALHVLRESLALLVEALVEAALEGVRQVLSPDGGQRAEATGGLDVADDSDDNDWGRLEDGDGLDDLLLVRLGASAVQLAHNVRHASLVAKEPGEVDRLASALREMINWEHQIDTQKWARHLKSDSQEVSA